VGFSVQSSILNHQNDAPIQRRIKEKTLKTTRLGSAFFGLVSGHHSSSMMALYRKQKRAALSELCFHPSSG
jgi:hypothetical protein